jgi:hypothetical protein
MKYDDLRRICAMMSIDLPPPNTSGWSHISCVFGPWKHKSGQDRSKGMAIISEEGAVSAYMCPACKSQGRIENLARELGRLRGQDYSAAIDEARRVENMRLASLPPWEQRNVQAYGAAVEELPEPLDDLVFDPEVIFDPIEDDERSAAYLASRRVSIEGANKAGMRFDPDKRRIVFPVYDREMRLFGFTGRSIESDEERSFWSRKDNKNITMPKVLDYANLPKRLLILGEHRWTTDKPTVIVEGLIAYARFLTEGVDDIANVGALLGSEMTPGKAAILKHWARPTHLLLDPDPAGDAGIYGKLRETGKLNRDGSKEMVRDIESGALFQLAEHMPLFVPNFPEGINDPDDLNLDMVQWMITAFPPSPKPKLPKPMAKKGGHGMQSPFDK